MKGRRPLLEVVPLGSSRHPILRSWWRRRWTAPSLVVFDLTPFGFGMPDPELDRFHVRMRTAGSEWGPGSHRCSVYRTLRIPLQAGSEVDTQVWADRPDFDRLVFERRLEVPDWDIYMILIRIRPFLSRAVLSTQNQIEAGWVSEYWPTARVLNRAQPSKSAE